MTDDQKKSLRQQLQAGIEAAKLGNRATARQLLEAVIAQDATNELAWIWLAGVVETTQEKRVCLERVLKINPNNERARQALAKLGGKVTDGSRQTQSTPVVKPAATTKPNRSNRALLLLLLVVVVLGVGIVVSSLLNSNRDNVVVATRTPLPVGFVETAITNTPLPTATPLVVIVRTRELPTFPPTFTPTATETPQPTRFPTATPFPDSMYTLFYSSRGELEAQPSLYTIRGDGTGLQPLLENARHIAFNATGEQVVFVRDVLVSGAPSDPEDTAEANATQGSQLVGELFIAPTNDLANARQLTRLGRSSAYTPQWSPDSRQIVFVSDYTGNDELFVIDVANGIVQQLTNNNAIDKDPHWSPDGTQIVYASDQDSPGITRLYLMTFVLGEAPTVRQLNRDAGSSSQPRWSPNGERIVYVNDRSGSGDIYSISRDGQRTSTIFASPAEERAPVWSPDGRFVLFLSNREDDVFQMYWVEPPQRAPQRINRDGRETTDAVFRPDLLLRVVGERR